MKFKFNTNQKTAILITSLPYKIISEITKDFNKEQIKEISLEIAKLPYIPPDVRNVVINEFFPGYKPEIIEEDTEIDNDEDNENNEDDDIVDIIPLNRPFDFLSQIESNTIFSLLEKDHPHAIAIILSYLEARQASDILRRFPRNLQVKVARELAEIQRIDSDILSKIKTLLENRLKCLIEGNSNFEEAYGKDALLNILSYENK